MSSLHSLSLRLLLLTLAVVLACGGVAVVVSYRNAIHEADELMDAQLAQTGQTLLAFAGNASEDADDIPAADTGPARHKYQPKLMFQLWHTHEGRTSLVLRSPNAPPEPIIMRRESGFTTGAFEGRTWRFFSQSDVARGLTVVVGQDVAIREELAQETAQHGLIPFLIGLPLLGAALFFAIRGGLAPLRELADHLSRRAPDQLAPVQLAHAPRELAPVVDALNRLFGRVGATLENERRFTSDAAHELRTPLAALLAQLRVAQLTEDAGERRQVLEKCAHGAKRMTHLVEQLLTLARLEAGPAVLAREPVRLDEIATTVCADLGASAVAKGIALELDAEQPVPLAGQPELLHVLIRNLVDNAIRYAPLKGSVLVAVVPSEDGARITVQDNGPGVPPDQRALLGQRFRRLTEQGIEGVGLGLSIVQRVVSMHGGTVQFDTGTTLPGLCVTVSLPAGAM